MNHRQDKSNVISQEFSAEKIHPVLFDILLSQGWRHFGTYFYRYNVTLYNHEAVRVLPLRIDLNDFRMTKKQRRIERKNSCFTHEFTPTIITQELIDLFLLHREKFTENRPENLHDFFSEHPSTMPCKNETLIVKDREKIIAASFLDIGSESTSSIYAMYDPSYSSYSPGIFTILKEIEYSIKLEKRYYYHGYIYNCNSFYDYKKHFHALEYFDWNGEWLPFNETKV